MKVLMLGWEFPPIISGGLGVACKGIADALSKKVDLNLILPSAKGTINKGYRILGTDSYIQFKNNYKTYITAYYQNEKNKLNPYENKLHIKTSEYLGYRKETKREKSNQIKNLYGSEIINNINKYKNSVISLCKKIDFDLIHAHDWMTASAGIEIKRKYKKPLVLHIHSLETDRGQEDNRGLIYNLEKNGMDYADLILTVSQYTKNKIISNYKINPNKIEVAHNGNNPISINKIKKKNKEITVSFIGRMTHQKGPEYFLKIAKKILSTKLNFRFVLAGSGEKMNSLIEYSAFEELGDKIHYTGFLNEDKLKELMQETDIYCMTSVSEPFGLSAVEAASWSIPCILSKQSGVTEVLKNSLKFDFWDIEKAASLIISIAENNMLKKEITENALKELKKISWNKTAETILKHYQSHHLINN